MHDYSILAKPLPAQHHVPQQTKGRVGTCVCCSLCGAGTLAGAPEQAVVRAGRTACWAHPARSQPYFLAFSMVRN